MEIEKRIEDLEKKLDELMHKLDGILSHDNIGHTKCMPSKKESPREFFLKFNPKKDTEKALVAIYYLEKGGLRKITVNEISNALKEMREKIPANISDKIQLLDKRALVKLVGREGKRKCWIVSNKGEEFLKELQKNAGRE